jgi:DNA-binding transcriptional MerR regulator
VEAGAARRSTAGGHETVNVVGMMTIGEFARRSRLPASTLRYYHERGLLVPARVDAVTGYRYYGHEQLGIAAVVHRLRGIGVAPETIGAIVDGGADPATMIEIERRRIEAEIAQRTDALARLARLERQLTAPPTYTVTVEDRPAVSAAAVHGRIRCSAATGDLRALMVALRRAHRAAGLEDPAGYGAVFPLDLETDPTPVTVFARAAHGDQPVGATLELPAGRFLVTAHHGDDAVEPAYGALLDRARADRLRPGGAVVEEYDGTRAAPSTRVALTVAG